MTVSIRIIFAGQNAGDRRLFAEAFNRAEGLELVGVALDGTEALRLIRSRPSDVLVMDADMSGLDGCETVKTLRQFNRQLPVILFSAFARTGEKSALDGLSPGTIEYTARRRFHGSLQEAFDYIGSEVVPRIRSLVRRARAKQPSPTISPTLAAPAAVSRPASSCSLDDARRPIARAGSKRPAVAACLASRVGIVAIGASTGGPKALASLIPKISPQIRVPIVLVQHMPGHFTDRLASQLNGLTELSVREGRTGESPQAGSILVAPGDYHMKISGTPSEPRVVLHQGPEVNSCRPAVDVLFRSVAEVYKDKALGVVLTGMGQDGLDGARSLVQNGSRVITQDEATCVVWGMPRAVEEAGLSDSTLPLNKIHGAIHQYTPTDRVAAPMQPAGLR